MKQRWQRRQERRDNEPRKRTVRPARMRQLRRSATMRLNAAYGSSLPPEQRMEQEMERRSGYRL